MSLENDTQLFYTNLLELINFNYLGRYRVKVRIMTNNNIVLWRSHLSAPYYIIFSDG